MAKALLFVGAPVNGQSAGPLSYHTFRISNKPIS